MITIDKVSHQTGAGFRFGVRNPEVLSGYLRALADQIDREEAITLAVGLQEAASATDFVESTLTIKFAEKKTVVDK